MRITIIGNNDCARATRHLLRQAGFAVSEFASGDAGQALLSGGQAAEHSALSAGDLQTGYAIRIELAPQNHPGSSTLANSPESAVASAAAEPSFAPGLSPHDQPAPADEETSAAPPPAADVSSPASRSGAFSPTSERRQRDSSSSQNSGPPQNDTPFEGGGAAAIHFDSVEGALETAVLRHVTQLWYGPVMVDRPGGTVHNERELRIVVPATAGRLASAATRPQGEPRQNDAAAKAVEFGVLRGLLDLLEAARHTPQAGRSATQAAASPEAVAVGKKQPAGAETRAETKAQTKKRKWWARFRFLFMALLLAAPLAQLANSKPKPSPFPAPAAMPSPTPAQLAAWRLAFKVPIPAAEPQGQQPNGALFGSVYDSGNTALKVNCVVGCSATSGFSDNSAFSVGSTTINVLGAFYTSGSAPSVSSGNAGRLRMDSNSYLYVDCVTGCSGGGGGGGTSSNFGSAFPTAGTAMGATNGTNMEPLQVNGSGYLETLLENSSMAVTGTFWQSTQPVSLASLPALASGSNTIGAVTQASGPWTQNITQWDSTALGAPSAYGTSPGAVNVPGVNAYVTNTVPVSGTFWQTTQPVSAASLPLPSGASTSADQCGYSGSNCNVNLAQLDGAALAGPSNYGTAPSGEVQGVNAYVTNTVPVSGTFWQTTQPVSAASLPLPSGASTSADQCGYSTGSACDAIGTLGDNGAAATTNRVGVLPGIAESNVPSAETAGRDTAIATDLQRQAIVSQMPEPSFASYEAAGTVSSASSATDVAVISGNATNTVEVTRVVVTCTQTTAGIISLYLVKRSSADSSGTSSSLTAVPMDSNYAAASTAAKVYTANPTTGTAVGTIDVANIGCMATGTTSPNDIYILNLWQKPIVLRGTTQQLAVNLNGATVSGGSFAIRFEWIETSNL